MATSVGLPSRLTSWTSSYSNDSLLNLRNVSYAVAGLFVLILGSLWLRSKKTALLKIEPEWFCQRRHVTLLQKDHECINDSIYLRFDKKFAQGIVKIELDNLIPPGLRTLYLYCRYKNSTPPHDDHCPDFHRIPKEQRSNKLLIQNLPYQEEVTLQIFRTEDKDANPLWEKTFRVDHALAEYFIKAENNTHTLIVQPRSLVQGFHPVTLSSIPLDRPMHFFIHNNRVIVPYPSTNDRYVFENKDPHMVKLNLEFSFDPALCYTQGPKKNTQKPKLISESEEYFYFDCKSYYPEAPKHVMFQIIVDPQQTVEISKEFILQRFKDVFLRATSGSRKKPLPENPNLCATHIQLISYPENHGK